MSTTFFRALVCLTLSLAWSCAVHAHEDTLIALKGTKLVGLPDEPAELDLKSSRLRIGNREMKFTPFLKSFFEQPHDLRISASWYHGQIAPTLPPYILFYIRPKKKDFSYQILLNLRTLDLIELSVGLQESNSTTRSLAIVVGEQVREEIRRSIRLVK